MSATEPGTPQPDERPSFDNAAERLFASDAAPAAGAQDGQQQDAGQSGTNAVAPAVSAEQETTAEPIDYRARFEEAERQRQETERKMWSYQGNLMQAQQRQKVIEAERDQFKTLATDANARDNQRWEAAIKQAPDEQTRQLWQQQYDADRTLREAKAEREALALERQQSQEAQDFQRTQYRSQAETAIRGGVLGEIAGAIPRAAQAIGLPSEEVKDLLAELNSPQNQLLMRSLPVHDPDPSKPDVDKYRAWLIQKFDHDLMARKQAYESRQIDTNRQQAQGVYRGEQPVGGGGTAIPDTTRGLSFDDAFDTINSQFAAETAQISRR